jgi:hypothetical protein
LVERIGGKSAAGDAVSRPNEKPMELEAVEKFVEFFGGQDIGF